MRKNKWIIFLAAAFFVFLSESACKNRPVRKEEGKNLFQLRKMALSILLYPEQTNGSPRMNCNFILLDISGNEDRENFFKGLLYDGQSPGEYKDALIESYRTEYLKAENLNTGKPDEPSGIMDWEYTEQMDFRTFMDRWVMISRDREYYTGGAHGMSQKTFYTVDLEELKALSWEDMFTAPENPELYRLILEALREQSGLDEKAPLSSGIYFDDEPDLTDNFFLHREGMGFHWNPYEIAPYSEGHIEAIIPWEKLEGLLSEYGREAAAALNS